MNIYIAICVATILIVGAVVNVIWGLEDEKASRYWSYLSNPRYFKAATIFCFLLLLWVYFCLNYNN